MFFLPEIRVIIVGDNRCTMKSLGQFVHPLLPPSLTMNSLFLWCPKLSPPGSRAQRLTGAVGVAAPRALPAGSAQRVRAVGSARPGTLAPRAPGGGDAVPLISAVLTSNCPSWRRRERAARARKLLHLQSFTLSWAGEGWEETRPPRGQARRAGGRKGGDRFPPLGGASPHLSGLWTRRRGGRTARPTGGHVLGRAGGRAPGSGRGAVPPAWTRPGRGGPRAPTAG